MGLRKTKVTVLRPVVVRLSRTEHADLLTLVQWRAATASELGERNKWEAMLDVLDPEPPKGEAK